MAKSKKKKIIKWLKGHSCYTQFKNNIQLAGFAFSQSPDFLDKYFVHTQYFTMGYLEFLSLGFLWHFTKEGDAYWRKIDKQYKDYYDKHLNK